jgi:hypothetical protein
MNIPPVKDLWSLVTRLEAARQGGRVTMLQAVVEVYPAQQAVEAVLASEHDLFAESAAERAEVLAEAPRDDSHDALLRLQAKLAELEECLRASQIPGTRKADIPWWSTPRLTDEAPKLLPAPPAAAEARAGYSLRKDSRGWTLVFDGSAATLKDELAVLYISHLLSHPNQRFPAGMLPQLCRQRFRRSKARTLESEPAARLADRSEESEFRSLMSVAEEVEVLLSSGRLSEPEKLAARERLEGIKEHLEQHKRECRKETLAAASAVRKSLVRFQRRLRVPIVGQGKPDPVLAQFADHLERYLLAPSSRWRTRKAGGGRARIYGSVVYEPPPDVVWSCPR